MIAGVGSGFTQFFLPTHLLAVVALGLVIGQGARVRLHLALFALGLLAGSLAIAAATRETPAALVLLAIAAIAGIMTVLTWAPPFILAAALSLGAGAALALNMPPQALTIPAAVGEQVGSAIAALATIGLVTFVATKATRSWQQIGVRILGSWIAASAILVLALRLAR
jgi:urease accessory protein